MAKKKNKGQAQEPFSPKKFLKERMRSIPIGDCYMSDDINIHGEGIVLITRKHTGGRISVGCFLVDIWCTGVKDTYCKLRMDQPDFEEFLERFKDYCSLCTYNEVHNLIYGAIEFAEEAGIPPHKDFVYTKYFLEEDTDDIPLIEYEYGKDGKHLLVCKSQLEASRYLSFMKKKLSKDEFDYIIGLDNLDDDDDDYIYYDDDDDADDDYDEYEEIDGQDEGMKTRTWRKRPE